jgi:hypothetical protein
MVTKGRVTVFTPYSFPSSVINGYTYDLKPSHSLLPTKELKMESQVLGHLISV